MMLEETYQQKQSMLITMVPPNYIQAYSPYSLKSSEMLKRAKHKILSPWNPHNGQEKGEDKEELGVECCMLFPVLCALVFDFPLPLP